MTLSNATHWVVFPRKGVSLGDIFQKKRGLVIFGGTLLKCAGTTKLSVFCLISPLLDQESSWSADQVTGVFIYRRTRVSVLMTLSACQYPSARGESVGGGKVAGRSTLLTPQCRLHSTSLSKVSDQVWCGSSMFICYYWNVFCCFLCFINITSALQHFTAVSLR